MVRKLIIATPHVLSPPAVASALVINTSNFMGSYFLSRESIASNVYCNADMQYSARTVQVFVATYIVITFLETRDVRVCHSTDSTFQLRTPEHNQAQAWIHSTLTDYQYTCIYMQL